MHSDLFVPAGRFSALPRRLLFFILTPLVAVSAARAGVYLTSYSFATNNLPQVYTNESLPSPYRLRAKFAGNYHAANGWNNNWQTLEGVPGAGSTTVELYWVKYASDQTTILEIGPFYQYSVYIAPPNVVSSQSATTYGNQPFTPAYFGGGGTGAWQFVISGYTNWGGTQTGTQLPPSNTPSSTWVPPGAGSYTFYVRKLGNGTYLDSNISGPYALTVVTQTWNWSTTPSSAPSGGSYTVIANMVNAGGQPYVTLYKNGGYFSAGWYGTSGSTYDYGAQTVNYLASFSNYTGNSGSSSRQVQILPSYSLSLGVNPAGAGGVSGYGIYQGGTSATASASANSGYTFTNWTGTMSSSSNPWSIYMDSDKTETANFSLNAPSATGAGGIISSGFVANWSSNGSATGYRLDVSTNSSFSGFVSGYQDLSVGNTTSYSVNGLTGSTTYYYRVRAATTSAISANSNTASLTTAPPAPTALNASNFLGTSFTANWSTSPGTTGYRLDVSPNNAFSSYVSGYQDLNVGNATACSVGGLTAGTTYYYRVRAYNGSGTSSNSNTIAAGGTQTDSANQNQLNIHIPTLL
jgi:uncharacterized repeat protein (TIGR02543 family)